MAIYSFLFLVNWGYQNIHIVTTINKLVVHNKVATLIPSSVCVELPENVNVQV